MPLTQDVEKLVAEIEAIDKKLAKIDAKLKLLVAEKEKLKKGV
ncbi:MAG: hypothetical protein QXS81_01385 [Candidatus Micrarchaeaceae archaeon]